MCGRSATFRDFLLCCLGAMRRIRGRSPIFTLFDTGGAELPPHSGRQSRKPAAHVTPGRRSHYPLFLLGGKAALLDNHNRNKPMSTQTLPAPIIQVAEIVSYDPATGEEIGRAPQ